MSTSWQPDLSDHPQSFGKTGALREAKEIYECSTKASPIKELQGKRGCVALEYEHHILTARSKLYGYYTSTEYRVMIYARSQHKLLLIFFADIKRFYEFVPDPILAAPNKEFNRVGTELWINFSIKDGSRYCFDQGQQHLSMMREAE